MTYLDYASTTPMDPKVLETMLPYFTEHYGNASAQYSKGLETKQAVDRARKTVAGIFECNPSEIAFTSGGTESNNIAILGAARANKAKGTHLITTKVEHASVLNPFKQLEKEGFTVTYLSVNKEGFIDLKELENAITEQTTLVSIMYVNNEIGTIEKVAEIAEICEKNNTLFHTDACQAAGYLPINIKADLITINGGKIYGPKSTGALYIKKRTMIEPIVYGGGHEKNIRSGTLNTPGIIGLAKALEIAQEKRKTETERLTELRDYTIKEIQNKIPQTTLNGPTENRICNNINISIPKVDGREMVLQLDNKDICISAGSACNATDSEISHVLTAIGKYDLPSIRISLGRFTKKEDVERIIEELAML